MKTKGIRAIRPLSLASGDRIRSLSIRTDMIFHQFDAEIFDRGDYLCVKTPSRPDYFWGNYLIVQHRIEKEKDFEQLLSWYRKEFDTFGHFITLAFDIPDYALGDEDIVSRHGFKIYRNKTLATDKVVKPPKYNKEIEFRIIDMDREFDDLVALHVDDSWYLPKEHEIPFLRSKFDALRKIHHAGDGHRFGAYLKGRLVADLGIYKAGQLARFNDVITHRDHRRQGICGTLVYLASRYALQNMDVETLVMEADEEYHAGGIYESTGFQHVESFNCIEWTGSG